MKTTRKKVKVIGTAEYIRADTGEVEQMQVISMQDRDFNFHKIWLQHIIQSFDLIGNQKTRLAFWLISEMDSENKICYTLRQMADKANISLETVRVTVKTLIDGEFLVKQNQGVYRVHPDRVFKGCGTNRMNVLLQYNQLVAESEQIAAPIIPAAPATDEEKMEAHGQQPMICKHCGGTELFYNPEGKYGPWYKCKACGKGTSVERRSA